MRLVNTFIHQVILDLLKRDKPTSRPPQLTAQPPDLLKPLFKSIFGKQNTNYQIDAMTHPYPWTQTIQIGF
jgi:hypothetical protein